MSNDLVISRVMYERRKDITPTADDCVCAAYGYQQNRDWVWHGYFGILVRLMLAGFCLLLFVGCNQTPSDEIKARAAELSALLTSSNTVATKQDTILEAIEANTVAIGEVKTKVETLEASLVSSQPNGKEVIKSALEPQKPAQAHGSQSSQPVASASAVRLTSDGTRLRWNIAGNWNPTILETAAHLRQDHGVNTDGMSHQQLADLHAAVHEGRTTSYPTLVSRGTSCPNGICPTNSRPRRGLFGWRR